MKTGKYGLQIIKHYEGLELKPYICPAGYLTIGYGHLIKENETFTKITEYEAEEILKKDIVFAENAVNRLIYVALNQYQFDALVSFTFNLGSGSLQSSTLRRVINRGDYNEAPYQIRRWKYSRGVELRGLVKRRNDEAILFGMLSPIN